MTGIHNVHEIFKVVTGVVKITLLKSWKFYVGLQVITGHISTTSILDVGFFEGKTRKASIH